MSEEKFLHYDLKLLEPTFGSSLTDLITELDYLKMLASENEGTRKYVLRFDNNYLLRGVIKSLGKEGFLPAQD